MAATPVRHPAVAGRFYPREPEVLRNDVRAYLSGPSAQSPVSALGCIAPHAGYMYSGLVAGSVFASLEIPDLCLVLCPNHTGMGKPLAITSEGEWETPLGNATIDCEFAAALKQRFPLLNEDSAAHRNEHAAEVELPFLQVLQPRLKFVPIALGTRQFEVLEQLGSAIADVISARGNPVLIVASSDMNHYESDAVTRIKDHLAIDAIVRLDARALYDVVTHEHITMCGVGPAIAMLTATKKLGARSATLVKYATSGDVSGERDFVVGYAGIVIQ
jgi:MEMO1 family protein